MKNFRKIILVFLAVITIFGFSTDYKIAYAENYLYLGGEVCGFDLVTDGVTIVGLCDVVTKEKNFSPAKDAGIKVGDTIIKINNTYVNSETDINKLLSGELTLVETLRGSVIKSYLLYPAMDLNGEYKLGIFIRNNVSGIGTITYYKENGDFGALGHEVVGENNMILNVVGGNLFQCKITNILKGTKGTAGEIQGFLKRNQQIGNLSYSKTSGIFGKIKDFDNTNYKRIEIAKENEVKIGSAYAYSNVSVEYKYYKISIIKVDNNSNVKNYVIKIDDENLLDITGGIVQGMSGTPIIQDNKIVGAITHVFINDSTRGYGININSMLGNN